MQTLVMRSDRKSVLSATSNKLIEFVTSDRLVDLRSTWRLSGASFMCWWKNSHHDKWLWVMIIISYCYYYCYFFITIISTIITSSTIIITIITSTITIIIILPSCSSSPPLLSFFNGRLINCFFDAINTTTTTATIAFIVRDVFLSTFQIYCTPEELWDKLMERYEVPEEIAESAGMYCCIHTLHPRLCMPRVYALLCSGCCLIMAALLSFFWLVSDVSSAPSASSYVCCPVTAQYNEMELL